jgi:hypothetical protein
VRGRGNRSGTSEQGAAPGGGARGPGAGGGATRAATSGGARGLRLAEAPLAGGEQEVERQWGIGDVGDGKVVRWTTAGQ